MEKMEKCNFDFTNYFKEYPDKDGYFGKYGGAYISDDLKEAMAEITEAYFRICKSRKFIDELRRIRKEFQGRPTPITHLERLSNSLGNVQLYAKREDLNPKYLKMIDDESLWDFVWWMVTEGRKMEVSQPASGGSKPSGTHRHRTSQPAPQPAEEVLEIEESGIEDLYGIDESSAPMETPAPAERVL